MEKIIKAAVERGASDLHIKAGDVFRARINGKLVPLTKQRLTPDQTRAIALKLISSDEDRAADRPPARLRLLLGHAGRRPLPGQRAAAALVVHDRDAGDPVHGADPRVARPARRAGAARRVGARARSRHRRERERQELHRGGHGAPHQPAPSTSTSSPSRIRSSSCTATSAARITQREVGRRHREPGDRAPGRAPAGSRRRRDRRDRATPTRSTRRSRRAETGHLVIASMPTPDVIDHHRADPRHAAARGARDRPDAARRRRSARSCRSSSCRRRTRRAAWPRSRC